ncbi:MAG TPA: nicotinate-nicotinamide nucleotide adenylyltransferase [Terriglobales bacterium]|nr:nicotinate-nicotinamide nucleotide adenylyltransferase [Terriglobales bacterium]
MRRAAPPAPRRIGLLGGTFDPIHRGHVALARAALGRFRLDRVYFLPARRPGHKAAPEAGFEDRYAMVALALAGQARMLPLATPAREGFTYSIDDVTWTASRFPGARQFFLIGADAFAEIATWKSYRALLRRVEFIIAPRTGFDLDALAAALPRELGARAAGESLRLRVGRAHWLGEFRAPGRSTDLRRLLAERRPAARRRVPARVLEYIYRAGLYRPNR